MSSPTGKVRFLASCLIDAVGTSEKIELTCGKQTLRTNLQWRQPKEAEHVPQLELVDGRTHLIGRLGEQCRKHLRVDTKADGILLGAQQIKEEILKLGRADLRRL